MDLDEIKKTILKLDKQKRVKFIILFGSVAEGRNNALSDVDVAVYYEGNKKERFNFRLTALSHLPDNVDLQIFQDLPLYIQKNILRGKVLYYDDFQFIFNQFMNVIREFDTFEKYYEQYLSQMMAT